MAMLVLFSGFAAVIVVGSILVAVNDWIEGLVERRRDAARERSQGRSRDRLPGVVPARPRRSLGERPRFSPQG